jgi:hypothetical protein
VFENRALRKLFGSKRGEVTGDWRRLHTEELHDLYCSPNIIMVTQLRRTRWVGHVSCTEEKMIQDFGGET